MKSLIRKSLWKVLGSPPGFPNGSAFLPPRSNEQFSWQTPADTIASRNFVVDMALYNVQIGTRCDAVGTDGRTPIDPNSLIGDYAEFGVFQGRTFMHSYMRGVRLLPWMRFLAFDSFEGLPEPKGEDAGGEFWAGQFSCSQQDFEATLQKHDVDMDRVRVVPGWFDQSLTEETKHGLHLNAISIAYIDCDLYESTIPVLRFLTDLVRQGSILLFDDWYCFRGDPRRGVQKATGEWLREHPEFELVPWLPFSHHGLSFILNKR